MFGYIRPHTPELRVRELERFRALYCGVCRALGKRCGYAARFVLSYDFVFLAAVLWEPDADVTIRKCRCPAGFKKKRCAFAKDVCGTASPIDKSAELGVILAYHKLRDNAADEGFLKAAAARLAMLSLHSAYRRAIKAQPDFDIAVRARLSALDEAEHDVNAPLDALADKFALLLSDMVANEANESRARILQTLLYHVGRWIYLADARDDLAEDARLSRSNALASRNVTDEALALTMTHSASLAIAAFELLPETPWSSIVRNILYLGMTETQSQILRNVRQNRRRHKV